MTTFIQDDHVRQTKALVDMAFGVVRFGLIGFNAQLELPRKATGSRRLIGIYAHRLSLGLKPLVSGVLTTGIVTLPVTTYPPR